MQVGLIGVATILLGPRHRASSQTLGIKEVDCGIWLVRFPSTAPRTSQPSDTPSARGCHPGHRKFRDLVPGLDKLTFDRGGGIRTHDLVYPKHAR